MRQSLEVSFCAKTVYFLAQRGFYGMLQNNCGFEFVEQLEIQERYKVTMFDVPLCSGVLSDVCHVDKC